jgi:hypothetical protein
LRYAADGYSFLSSRYATPLTKDRCPTELFQLIEAAITILQAVGSEPRRDFDSRRPLTFHSSLIRHCHAAIITADSYDAITFVFLTFRLRLFHIIFISAAPAIAFSQP